MDRARLHLRGGRSIHIHSPFARTTTAMIEEVDDGEVPGRHREKAGAPAQTHNTNGEQQ
jgi:hypothetical protein